MPPTFPIADPHPLARRAFLGLGLASAAGATAGCFASQPPVSRSGPSEGAHVPIEVWSGWTENAAKQIESILADFNKSQSAVVAKHVVVPGDMSQKLLAAISAKNPPATAIVFGAGIAYQLAARKALVAVDDLATTAELTEAKQWMTPGLWELGRFADKTYFVPMWAQAWGLFVNRTLATKAGVDPDKPPADLDELAAAWVEMTQRDAKGQISVLGGVMDNTQVAIARFHGKLVSDDGETVTPDSPEVVAAVSWADAHRAKLGRAQVQKFQAGLQGRTDRSGAQDPFLAGLVATQVIGSWEYDTILKYAPQGFEYTVWPIPSPKGVTGHGSYTYGDGFLFPRGAAESTGGWQVARTLTGISGNVDLYSKLFTTWQCVNAPISAEAPKSEVFKKTVSDKCPGYEQVFLADVFKADYLLYPPKIPTSSSYTTALSSTIEKINLGQLSVEAGLAAVQASAQHDLDTWRKQNP